MPDPSLDPNPDPQRPGPPPREPGRAFGRAPEPIETFRADLPPPRRKGKRGGTADGGGDWRRKRGRRLLAMWLVLASLVFVLTASITGLWVHRTYLADVPPLPPREQLYAFNRAPGIKFFDRYGAYIADRGPKYGDRVTLSQLPPYVPQAFLAAEDRRFYQHGPIDLRAILRAARANHQAGRVVEGGSTLSQQLAKGLFLTPEQTFRRKIQEAVLAARLESVLSKDEVLELYLNRVFFGANTFGLDGASRTYFGKPASQLTLSEAALLAALPKAPSRMAPHRNMPLAMERQRLVLQRMQREGWITAEQVQAAAAAPPKVVATGLADDGDMGYALDYATNEVLKLAGPNSPDLMVRLTIDPKLQATGAEVLRRVVQANGRPGGARQGAMVAIADDGAVRTMVGGVDYRQSVFNRAVQARRQPGSSFKPFIYAAALEEGVSPNDIRIDGPVRLGGWRPQNYGGGYRGAVTVETALARSINTVAVKLGREVGPEKIGDLARRFGLTTIPAKPDLSVTLGAYETPLIEMVSGFQVFQQAGNRLTPYIIDEVRTIEGKQVFLHRTSSPLPVYDPVRAGMMVRMMQRVISSGTGTRAGFGRPAAGKTGTSQNWRDAWFVGFTPDMVAGVWVGNDDDRPMNRVTGGEVAAQIWRRYMIVAHDGLPVRDFDWIVPEPRPAETVPRPASVEPAPQRGFYDDLSDDFAAAAGDEPTPESDQDPLDFDPAPPQQDAPY